jgi:hypothetical protein
VPLKALQKVDRYNKLQDSGLALLINEKKELTVKCYVNDDGKTTLKCPNCEIHKRIDFNKHVFSRKPFKAICKCGTQFRGIFEFRRHFRKQVRLSGHYTHKITKSEKKDILVKNLSLHGVGFTCLGRPDLKVGDNLEITFWLDNPKSSKIQLWVEVIFISGNYIGAQRRDIQIAQSDLGFYLQG